jgi:hypothetical protein
MAIKSVQFRLNGQTYDLTYDNTAQAYKATITAPSQSSYGQNDDHKYHGEVIATDTANNSVTATVADFPGLGLRVVEQVKPNISVTYPAANAYISNNKPVIRWTVQDTGSGVDASTIGLVIDNGTAITDGIVKTAVANGFSCEYTPTSALREGAHSLIFSVSDNDGNAAEEVNVTFKVDTVPPTLNVTKPADSFITNNPELTVMGTTNDEGSSPVTVEVNGESVMVNADGSFSTTVELTEGENTVTVVATDGVGKSTTLVRKVTLDTVPPKITSVSLTPNPVDAGQTYVVTVEVEK